MSIDLTNSWMNDPAFLSQSAHFFGALSVVMIAAYFWGRKGCEYAAIAFAGVMAVKEYWYDLVYELPKQTMLDSTLDYTFYLAGVGAALALTMLIKKPSV